MRKHSPKTQSIIQAYPYFGLVVCLVAVDQITKFVLASYIPHGGSHNIIPGFFNLNHVRNRGAIFGFFNQPGSSWTFILLTLFSLMALGLVVYYFFKVPRSEKLLKVALSLVLGGALGNIMDRLFRGYVIDFLDFFIGKYHWPSFNVADSCISVGAILLVFIFFFRKGQTCFPRS